MASSISGNLGEEVARSISEESPSHYILKIQSFSLLIKNGIEKYESGEFEAGGYKWKLLLYPNGNKSKNVKEHLSLYLLLADVSSLIRHSREVHAIFRFFLLDQSKDKYLIVHDAKEEDRRFHRLKHQWGFDEFIPIRMFNDVSNGYLLEDNCVFGAEVFVTKEMSSGKGESLSMIKDAVSSKHVWKIENFSKLDSECHESQEFFAGDQKWKIQLYPKGRRNGSGTHISMYLALADTASTLMAGSRILAEFTLRIQDQQQNRHIAGKYSYWFSASNQESGWAKFVSFPYFYRSGIGYLVKDICMVEAEVTVQAVATTL
ncbi:MATH domain and coiled-coil domain-containing protein At3g58370-like [Durio zibethinus]|uniref:MATH domain and coiled-coil domain-containing protein At3g58370-like n=1 Tax=Durio zibethinus TaxID=66656 RepID=A0A6P6A7P0_DURZI|nr:MATH domain and coiled-coil domain-containing protein At3g58370-like [Durio zibethinus]